MSRDDAAGRWIAAQECQDTVLRFMALFDARAWSDMEACVAPELEWQRPDQTLRGLARLREVLAATPVDVRVRHLITNLRASFEAPDRIAIESYFTVYRHVGALDPPDAVAPLAGPASMGRYRDELVRLDGRWKIARKLTLVDFRRG